MDSKESNQAALASPCCTTQGLKHSGDPAGKTITIGGIETYISEPPSKSESDKKRIILYLADVYGPFYRRAQLLQDYYASHGFIVIGIDYFFGKPIDTHTEPDFDRLAWMAKCLQRAKEVFPGWIKAVRDIYGTDAKYFAVGYSFGGAFALELATTDDIVAAALTHPAFWNEDHFRKLTKPLLLSCAEYDITLPTESRRRAEDILSEIKATYHVQLFSGVGHGFGTRGDPEVENSRWAKEKSAQGIIEWFERFSGSAYYCN